MHVETANYEGNPSIGLFCYATDKYCLVPHNMSEKLKKKFKEVLKVPLINMTAAGTDLLGVFFTGNNDILLVPEIMFDKELDVLNEHKIEYKIFKTRHTALGNNILVNENAAIVSSEYSDEEVEKLSKLLNIPVKKGKVANLDTVGSLIKGNNNGLLASSEIENFEKKFIEDNLKVKVIEGTINFGSQYISSGLVCNNHGFIIGNTSGGPEIQNADEALGFLEEEE